MSAASQVGGQVTHTRSFAKVDVRVYAAIATATLGVGCLAISGIVGAADLALVTVAAFLVILAVYLTRTMAQFVCLIIAFRPLVDVGAGSRQGALSPTEAVGVALLSVFSIWLVAHRRAVLSRVAGDHISWALAALVAILGLSTVGSTGPIGSIPFVLRILTGFAFYLVVDLLLARGQLSIWQVLRAAFLAAAIALVFPVLGVVGVPIFHDKDGLLALKSVFHLSNNFAYFLLPFITVASALSLRYRGKRQWFAVAFLILAVFELGLTETRGAWISAVVGLVIVLWLLERRLVWLPLIVTVVAVVFVPPVHDRVLSVVPSPDQFRTESSGTWRLEHWGDLLPLASASPVLGIGPDQSVKLTGKEPHNDMLRSYVELGAVGSAVFLWLLVGMITTATRACTRVGIGVASAGSPTAAHLDPTSPIVAGLAAFIGALLVAFTGENLIDNITMLALIMPTLAILRHVNETASPRITGQTVASTR